MKKSITYLRWNLMLAVLTCVWMNASAVVTNFPFIESFEANSATLADWSQVKEVGTAEWTFVNGSNGGGINDAFEGTRNARFIGNGDMGFRTKLVSPLLNLSRISSPKLSFMLGQPLMGDSDQNTTKVFYRVSATDPWVELAHYTDDIYGWTNVEIVLPNRSDTYQIAFEGTNNWGYANVIDLVKVFEAATPAVVSSFPFVESFETSSRTLRDWRQIVEEGTAIWTFAEGSNGGDISTAFKGSLNARFIGSIVVDSRTKLVSPPLDLSDMALPKLSFYLGQQSWQGSQNTTKLFYRTSATSPWMQLEYYTQSVDSWTWFNLSLPEASATYQIAFEGDNFYGYANVIDWVEVYEGILPTTVKSFPFVETFETASATLKDWRQLHVEGTHNWTFADGADGFGSIKTAFEGVRNAKFAPSSATGYSTLLISPMFDLSKIASAKLSFYLGQENWSGGQNTTKVLYRRNARSKWTELAHYTQSIAEWTLYEFTLPNPTSTYQIAFEAINYFGRPNVIDLVKVYDPTTGIHNPQAEDAMQVYMDGDLLKLMTVSHAPAAIQVYNLVGELVLLGKTNGNSLASLNVSTLMNGIYVVCVVQLNGVMLSRKVCIHR